MPAPENEPRTDDPFSVPVLMPRTLVDMAALDFFSGLQIFEVNFLLGFFAFIIIFWTQDLSGFASVDHSKSL